MMYLMSPHGNKVFCQNSAHLYVDFIDHKIKSPSTFYIAVDIIMIYSGCYDELFSSGFLKELMPAQIQIWTSNGLRWMTRY